MTSRLEEGVAVGQNQQRGKALLSGNLPSTSLDSRLFLTR